MKNLPFSASILVGSLALSGMLLGQSVPEHAPDGGTTQRVQSIDIPTITNAPFSAVVVTELTKIMPDGSTALIKNHRMVARDSLGRVFEERRFFTPNGDKASDGASARDGLQGPDAAQWIVCIVNTRGVFGVHLQLGDDGISAKPPTAAQSAANGTKWEDLGKKVIENVEVRGIARGDDDSGRRDWKRKGATGREGVLVLAATGD